MELATNPIKKGLNSFQLKMIALFFMTVDHFGAYQTLTISRTVNDILRILGRIAAPLFLFLLIEGLRHTRSKWKYLFRLYVTAVLIQIANILFSEYIAVGFLSPLGNIIPTFTYTALYIICIEWLVSEIKARRTAKALLPMALIVMPFLIVWANNFCLENSYEVVATVLRVFTPSPFTVEYSFIFVLLGIAWYFINNKVYNAIVFAILCVLCFFVPAHLFFTIPIRMFLPVFFNAFSLFVSTQWCMVLAVPFMLLYNGEKGRSLKYLFYGYYPLHQYLLFTLQLFVNGKLFP